MQLIKNETVASEYVYTVEVKISGSQESYIEGLYRTSKSAEEKALFLMRDLYDIPPGQTGKMFWDCGDLYCQYTAIYITKRTVCN